MTLSSDFFTLKKPRRVPDSSGQIEPGNIDLYDRPPIDNPDGSVSTVRSASFGTDKGETLVPTVGGGRVASMPDALSNFSNTGQHLGVFDTPGNADRYAQNLHNDYAAGKYDFGTYGGAISGDPASALPAVTRYSPAIAGAAQPVAPQPMQSDSMRLREPLEHPPQFRPQPAGIGSKLSAAFLGPSWANAHSGRPDFDIEQANYNTRVKGLSDVMAMNRQEASDALTQRNVQSEIDLRGAQAVRARNPVSRLQLKTIDDPENPGSPIPAAFNPATGQFSDPNTGEVLEGAKIYQKPSDMLGKLDPIVEAQIGPAPRPQNYTGKSNDPAYTRDLAAWGDKAEQIKNRMAGTTADARGRSYGRNRPVNVFDTFNGNRPVVVSAGEAMDNPDRYISQAGGGKALNQVNVIEDIRGTINNTRSAIKNLKNGFDTATRAKLAYALTSGDPGVMHTFMNSNVMDTLNPDQQDYIVALSQLSENAMAMRQVLGSGQGAQDMRNAIRATIPGPGTPNAAFASKQLDAFEATIDRLSRGVPRVPLNTSADSDKVRVIRPDGTLGTIPRANLQKALTKGYRRAQ